MNDESNNHDARVRLPQVEATKRVIDKTIVCEREGLKVVRLVIAAGGDVPEHHANVDVVVAVVRGRGTFTVAGDARTIAPGAVVDMEPRVRHAIHADEELELLVTHVRIERDHAAAPPACGA